MQTDLFGQAKQLGSSQRVHCKFIEVAFGFKVYPFAVSHTWHLSMFRQVAQLGIGQLTHRLEEILKNVLFRHAQVFK